MDQDLLKLLTKIKIQGKKIMGLEIDIVRLSSDRAYAAEILKRLSSSEDEDLVMTAIDFMGKLGLVRAPAAPEPVTASASDSADNPLQDKYTGRLR